MLLPLWKKSVLVGAYFTWGVGNGGQLSVLDVIEPPIADGLPTCVFNVIMAGGMDRLIVRERG